MREAGYTQEFCLAYDRVQWNWVQRFRRMQARTKLVDAPPRSRKAKPKIEVPFFTSEELMQELMGPIYYQTEQEAIQGIIGEYADVSEEAWNSIDDWDEE